MKKICNVLLLTLFLATLGLISHAQFISIKIQPFPPAYERPAPPSERHVWVDGDWVWSNGRYVWHAGFWTIPEPYHIWVKGYWETRNDGNTQWIPGHWGVVDQHIFVRERPRDVIETRPAAPSPRHVWIDGEWEWRNNSYGWKAGYWTLPQAHQRWIKGYWARHPNGTWFWVRGHWVEF